MNKLLKSALSAFSAAWIALGFGQNTMDFERPRNDHNACLVTDGEIATESDGRATRVDDNAPAPQALEINVSDGIDVDGDQVQVA